MSRDSSGTYTLVSGNPVVTGNTISSTWANNTLTDLKTEMTDSLSRSAKGGMLERLTGVKGATFTQSTTNTTGLTATGNGTAAGVAGTGGATGPGVTGAGGATSGNGATFTATSGHGVSGTAGGGSNAGVLGTASAAAGSWGVKGVASSANNGPAVYGQSNHADASGLYGQTNAGTAANIAAVYADSSPSGGYALIAFGDTVAVAPARSALRVIPQNAPANGQIGDMYVTTAGVLKICTVAGAPGTWVSVGAQ